MTGTDFIANRVRPQSGDTIVAYHVSQEQMASYLSEGVNEIIIQHPEASYVSSITTPVTINWDEADLVAEIPITDAFLTALMQFMLMRIFGEDSEDELNRQRSVQAQQDYEREML